MNEHGLMGKGKFVPILVFISGRHLAVGIEYWLQLYWHMTWTTVNSI